MVTKLLKPYDCIYLSPHFDDVSLSCGGTISKQCRAGLSVLVISAFTPPPENTNSFSPFAQHIEWIMGGHADLFSVRNEEDKNAMNVLGAERMWLDYAEAIYRDGEKKSIWYYDDVNSLFGNIHEAEYLLHQEIARVITNIVEITPLSTVYAPLAIGGHVDHRLMHHVSVTMADMGLRCKYYEEFPYSDPKHALSSETVEKFSASVRYQYIAKAGAKPELSHIAEDDMQAKVKSVASYTSQSPILFGSKERISSTLRAHALRDDPHHYSERFWSFDRH